MDLILLIILIGLVVGFGAVIFFINKKFSTTAKPRDDQALLMLQQQIADINKTLDSKLGQSTQMLQQQYGESAKIIRDVTERLTKLDETNRQVINFTDQLKSLQDILKNPKQRGVLGEYYLETLLKNILPVGSYQMQYPFKDGTIVDAVVKVKDQIIPIDSKFSLENYNRLVEERDESRREQLEKSFINDLKNRIVETSKYIKPGEGTMDFAFMFIPHEAIYYDLLINRVGKLKDEDTENLIQRAAGKYHVIIVSPTSFLAYLQTVLQGLNALHIEAESKEIRKRVEELARHLVAFDSYFLKLGNNLNTTVNMYDAARKEFIKIDKDVVRIAQTNMHIEPLQIERANKDE